MLWRGGKPSPLRNFGALEVLQNGQKNVFTSVVCTHYLLVYCTKFRQVRIFRYLWLSRNLVLRSFSYFTKLQENSFADESAQRTISVRRFCTHFSRDNHFFNSKYRVHQRPIGCIFMVLRFFVTQVWFFDVPWLKFRLSDFL